MARLRENIGSDDELPPLSEILAPSQDVVEGRARMENSPQREVGKERRSRSNVECGNEDDAEKTGTQFRRKQSTSGVTPNRRQRPLQKTRGNALLLPVSRHSLRAGTLKSSVREFRGEPATGSSPRKTKAVDHKGFIKDFGNAIDEEDEEPIRSPIRSRPTEESCAAVDRARASPPRAVQTLHYRKFVSDLGDAFESDEDPSLGDLSDFIVNESASETEVVSLRSRRNILRSPSKAPTPSGRKARSSNNDPSHLGDVSQSEIIDLISPIKDGTNCNDLLKIESVSRTCNDDPFSTLKFSPPRNRSPYSIHTKSRLVTPPSSPLKPRLQSPSKQPRIPPSPHRPSIDAFWSQDIINNWNDQHSPKKTPKRTPGRQLFPISDEEDDSPSASPRKSPSKASPRKDKAAIARRKAFDEKKRLIATSFLEELDLKVANGQIASLAAATGGIHIVWSKKLNSTAGRANWKRDALRTKGVDGTVTTTYRHHASIELAEKVIDDEDRLRNVLAHEYCHLTNFMISNIKTAPHGPSFKSWAAKVTTLFQHRNIEVTTKHSYKIDYKYEWRCTECGLSYERHSRSIDVRRFRCGGCRGSLVQWRPVPRGGGAGEGAGGGEWREYVKREFGRVKRENEGMGQGEIMALLGRGFREEREKGGVRVEVLEIDGLAERLGALGVRDGGLTG